MKDQTYQKVMVTGEMVVADTLNKLPSLWTPYRYHEEQQRLWHSRVRFRVVYSGRRGGKSDIAIRYGSICAVGFTKPNGIFVFAAPTHRQAKNIFWEKLKAMIPEWAVVGKPSETELTIRLINGAKIIVVGLDVPARIEGMPHIDGIVLDEYANMKPEVWTQHVRPALGTDGRYGWAWFIGVPEGRNHYWLLCNFAKRSASKNWDAFHWITADIDPYEAEQARQEMDEETYAQEYLGAFSHFQGRVYYNFDEDIHAPETHDIVYNPNLPLYLCFDFNVCGSAVILQEQPRPDWATKITQERKVVLDKVFKLDPFESLTLHDAQKADSMLHYDKTIVAIIDEVAILKNSNTNKICDVILKKYSKHEGDVYLYGDPAGAAAGSAKVQGSDWDLIRAKFEPIFNTNKPRRIRLKWRVSKAAPRERVRINATNSRIQSEDGMIRTLVSRKNCPYTIASLSGTVLDADGKIKKEQGEQVTHWSDAYGYYCARQWSITGVRATVTAW